MLDAPSSTNGDSETSGALTAAAAHEAIRKAGFSWPNEQETQEEEKFLQEQLAAMGVTQAQGHAMFEQVHSGAVTMAEAFGLTAPQLAAMQYRAYELLKANEPRRALRIYVALIELDPYQFAYQRGAAQCFHAMKEYGFALGYYRVAIATKGAPDFVASALLAECIYCLRGAQQGLQALDQALAVYAGSKQELPFFERLQAFRNRAALGQRAGGESRHRGAGS